MMNPHPPATPVASLLHDLMVLHDETSPPRNARRERRAAAPPRAGHTDADRQMDALRHDIIAQLARDEERYERENGAPPSHDEAQRLATEKRMTSTCNHVSLPVGERIRGTKTFGKRTYGDQGSVELPSPVERTAQTSNGPRFSKKMLISVGGGGKNHHTAVRYAASRETLIDQRHDMTLRCCAMYVNTSVPTSFPALVSHRPRRVSTSQPGSRKQSRAVSGAVTPRAPAVSAVMKNAAAVPQPPRFAILAARPHIAAMTMPQTNYQIESSRTAALTARAPHDAPMLRSGTDGMALGMGAANNHLKVRETRTATGKIVESTRRLLPSGHDVSLRGRPQTDTVL
jgi:hypothetical protein